MQSQSQGRCDALTSTLDLGVRADVRFMILSNLSSIQQPEVVYFKWEMLGLCDAS